MMRRSFGLVVLTLLWNGATHVRADPAAEQIVARHLEAIGGADAVRGVVSKRVRYWVHMLGRDAYLMERSWTRPDRMRTGRPGAATYTLTEGARSWRVGPDGRRELPAAAAASLSKLAGFDGLLVDPAQQGATLAYAGTVRYDMTDLSQVTVTFEDGVQWELFFDSSTGLLKKKTQPSFYVSNGVLTRGPDTHDYYFDYRPAGSVSYPHFWIQASEDHTHLFVVEDIETGLAAAPE